MTTTTVPKPRTPADARSLPHLVLVEELLSVGADPAEADWLLQPRRSLLSRLLGRA